MTVREVAEELVEEVEGPEETETGVDVDYESIQIEPGRQHAMVSASGTAVKL